MYYNRNRYYSPDTGRYITLDPIKLAGGLNSYQYTKDPINWIDPLGLMELENPNNQPSSRTPEKEVIVDKGEPPIPTYTIEEVDPRILISRQDKTEMSSNKVKRYRKNMREKGFDSNEPIEIVDVDGKLIIEDGHHRRDAAIGANLRKVTISIRKPVSKTEADMYLNQAAEAKARKGY